MPEMGESVTEGTVLEWAVAVGDSVAEGDTVVEVSTDKVDAEVPAPAAGTITKLLVEPDEVVAGRPATGGDERRAPRRRGQTPPRRTGRRTRARGLTPRQPRAPTDYRPEPPASPVAQRMAADQGVDVGSIQGSGAGGKVVKADVLAAADGATAPRRRRPPPKARRSRSAARPGRSRTS